MPDVVDRLNDRYGQLTRHDDIGFVRHLETYLGTLDSERRVRRILKHLRRESDKAERRFNQSDEGLVKEAIEIRRRLAVAAPEIDNSNQPRPNQASNEYGFWKMNSLASFDEVADRQETIGFAPLPYYDAGTPGRTQSLVQILRGRVHEAEYGVEFGRGANPQAKIREDLEPFGIEIENLQERHNVARRRFKHDETTLPGLADKRLRLFAASLHPEPFLRDVDEDELAYMERALGHVLANLGARGILRRALDGERLDNAHQQVFDRLVAFLRREVDGLHDEVIDRLRRKERSVRRRSVNALKLGSAKIVGIYLGLLLTAIAGITITYAKHWWGHDAKKTPPPKGQSTTTSR